MGAHHNCCCMGLVDAVGGWRRRRRCCCGCCSRRCRLLTHGQAVAVGYANARNCRCCISRDLRGSLAEWRGVCACSKPVAPFVCIWVLTPRPKLTCTGFGGKPERSSCCSGRMLLTCWIKDCNSAHVVRPSASRDTVLLPAGCCTRSTQPICLLGLLVMVGI